jgi:DNA-binding IclR family transcriptional regulator
MLDVQHHRPGLDLSLPEGFAEISRRGYAVQRGELRTDVASIAAYICAQAGQPVASLSIFMPIQRFPADGPTALGRLVTEAAAKISAGLELRGT